jgi:hypothetical protein
MFHSVLNNRAIAAALAMAILSATGVARAQDGFADGLNEFLQSDAQSGAGPRLCLGVAYLNHPMGAKILRVQQGSAAEAADIRPGDWIIAAIYRQGNQNVTRVAGIDQGHWPLQRIVQDVQGAPPTVTFLISRQGTLMVKRATLKPCHGLRGEGESEGGGASAKAAEESA